MFFALLKKHNSTKRSPFPFAWKVPNEKPKVKTCTILSPLKLNVSLK